MNKLFKFLIFTIISCSLFFVSSCESSEEELYEEIDIEVLEDAMDEINNTNYTVKYTISMYNKVEYGGEAEEVSVDSEVLMEYSSNKVYMETIANTGEDETIVKQYLEHDGNYVYSYVNNGNNWYEQVPISLKEYGSLNTFEMDLDIEDCFEFDCEDGVFKGKLKKLNEQMDDFKEEFLQMFGSYASLDDITIRRYEIELKDDQIYKIKVKLIMEMNMSVQEYNDVEYYAEIVLNMKFSKIGKTDVTTPYFK